MHGSIGVDQTLTQLAEGRAAGKDEIVAEFNPPAIGDLKCLAARSFTQR